MGVVAQPSGNAQPLFAYGCQPWPLMGQNSSPTVDGRPDVNHSENCGETCAAMIATWTTACIYYPSTIHDILFHSRDYKGGSDNLQLERFLHDFCGIPTTQYAIDPTRPDQYWRVLKGYLAYQKPVLILRYGDHPGASASGETRVYHWCVVVRVEGYGDTVTTVYIADPWTGELAREDAQAHLDWQGKTPSNLAIAAGVDRSRCIDVNKNLGEGLAA